MKRGFTLVELLVVAAVLAIAGTFVLATFSSSLRSNNKTKIISSIKQNGQSVLENMDKTIRNADKMVCIYPLQPPPPPSCVPSPGHFCSAAIQSESTVESYQTIVVVKDGIYTRYTFIPPYTVNIAGQSINGSIVQDSPVLPLVLSTSNINDLCGPRHAFDETNKIILTDINSQTGISIDCTGQSNNLVHSSCNLIDPSKFIFKRDKSSGFKDQITIKFTAGPGVLAPSSVAGQIDPITFQTTIDLR